MWLIASNRNGISSWELHRSLGVTQKTAWFMLHRIRTAMQDEGHGGKIGGEGCEVEVEETFIGGKASNIHKDRKIRIHRETGMQGGAGKAVVLAALERGGKIRTRVVADRTPKSIQPMVRDHVEPRSSVMSDEHGDKWRMDSEYVHQIVNHLEQYVDGNVHTNNCENFWSLLKRSIGGTYCPSNRSICSATLRNRLTAITTAYR